MAASGEGQAPAQAAEHPAYPLEELDAASEERVSAQAARAEEVDADGWHDILGTGAVLKRTVREGQGPSPEYKSIVHIHYQARIASTGTLSLRVPGFSPRKGRVWC